MSMNRTAVPAALDLSGPRISFEPESGVIASIHPTDGATGPTVLDVSSGRVASRWEQLPSPAIEALTPRNPLLAIWVFDLAEASKDDLRSPMAERWPAIPVSVQGAIWVSVDVTGVHRVVLVEDGNPKVTVLSFKLDPSASLPYGCLQQICENALRSCPLRSSRAEPSGVYALGVYARHLTAHIAERWLPGHVARSFALA